MNLLIVGSGKGSWIMRGQQLGAALGARVSSDPTPADFAWATIVVLVKRAGLLWAPTVHRYGLPLVWDALDFWKQPADNGFTETQARASLQAQIAAIRPTLTIGATEAMAEACGGVCVPHHSWEGLAPTPAREVVSTVAYEGNAVYLGRWRVRLEQECARRGWEFVVNPPDLGAADIIVALRDGQWDGWACREWKSGVKVVNAIAAGRPLIRQDSAASRESHPSGTTIVDPTELSAALEYWSDHAARVAWARIAVSVAPVYTLESIAARYQQILEQKVLSWAA